MASVSFWNIYLYCKVIFCEFSANLLIRRSLVPDHMSVGPIGFLSFGYTVLFVGIILEIKINLILAKIIRFKSTINEISDFDDDEVPKDIDDLFWFKRLAKVINGCHGNRLF